MIKHLLVFFLILILTGCRSSKLSIQNHYVIPQRLASINIGTPDPRKICPNVGQQLIVSWMIPQEFARYKDVSLRLYVRFYNKDQEEVVHAICEPKGKFKYNLLNKDYYCKGGVLTYRAEIIGDGCILDEWYHHLWAEWIELDL